MMKTRITVTAFMAVGMAIGVVFFGSAADANVIAIFNTGVDDGGVPLADNALDPHYTLSYSGPLHGFPEPGPDAIVATAAGGFPIGPWLGDNSTSAWITPAADTNGPGATDGSAIYTYATAFTTPIGGTITVSGIQSADNLMTGMELDGTAGTFTPVGFNTWGDFSVTANITGTDHTLSFSMHNGAGEANPDGPQGFRAEIQEIVWTPIPEPSTLVLAAVGLLGLALFGWRRKWAA